MSLFKGKKRHAELLAAIIAAKVNLQQDLELNLSAINKLSKQHSDDNLELRKRIDSLAEKLNAMHTEMTGWLSNAKIDHPRITTLLIDRALAKIAQDLVLVKDGINDKANENHAKLRGELQSCIRNVLEVVRDAKLQFSAMMPTLGQIYDDLSQALHPVPGVREEKPPEEKPKERPWPI